MKEILMIEDDAAIAGLIQLHLADLPARLTVASTGVEGIRQLDRQAFDLYILDVMLPDTDGIVICRHIRASDPHTPILMLTARSEEADKVMGLEAGADDYLTKPFGQQEFMARIRALLRRSERSSPDKAPGQTPATFAYKGLHIDLDKRLVTVDGQRTELTPKEFDLLVLLTRHPGKSFSRKELLSTVWGYTHEGYEHTVTAHINRLRNKIETDFANPDYILTAWGIGYRFTDLDPNVQHGNH